MKYTKDIGIAVILRNYEINKDLENIFKNSYNKSIKFFPKKPGKFVIYVCDNEEDYKKYSQPYYIEWSAAVGLGEKGIATRSPEFIEKRGGWKKSDFQSLMDHEISHIFWYRLCPTWSPQWFAEGLAGHIGNNFNTPDYELLNIIKRDKISSKILDYRYLQRNYKNGPYPRFQVWQSFVNYLITNYKIRSIRNFIRDFSIDPVQQNYKDSFKKNFGSSDKELFNEFLKKITKF